MRQTEKEARPGGSQERRLWGIFMTHLVTTTNRQAFPELSQRPHTLVLPIFLSSTSPTPNPTQLPRANPAAGYNVSDLGIPRCAVAHTENVNLIPRLSRGVVSFNEG